MHDQLLQFARSWDRRTDGGYGEVFICRGVNKKRYVFVLLVDVPELHTEWQIIQVHVAVMVF